MPLLIILQGLRQFLLHLIAGGGLSLVPAGYMSDRWSARRMLVFANLTTALALGVLLLRDGTSTLDLLVVSTVGGRRRQLPASPILTPSTASHQAATCSARSSSR